MNATQFAPLPDSLRQHPDLDAWLRIEPDGAITVFSGKVEIGQGIKTVIAQIAAEELDVSLDRIRVVLADTERTPDEGYTAGSNSTQGSGGAVRQAAAEARAILMGMAAAQLDAPVARLQVEDGMVMDPATESQVSYWELMGGRRFAQAATGQALPKSPQSYRVVGAPVPRLDLPAKVAGEAYFVDDMVLPNMVHGRIVRPPSPQARLLELDSRAVEQLPGLVAVVRDGSFLGVVAEREETAIAAAEMLRAAARWSTHTPSPHLADDQQVYEQLLHSPTQSFLVVEGSPTDAPIPPIAAPENAAHTLIATYYRPFQMHGALGPSAALAQMEDGRLTVWSHSQGPFPLRGSLAHVLNIDAAAIRVVHVEGPGCYGHNGADDAALDAALLARAAPGRPVLLKWTRGDEHRWEPVGSAMVVQIQASLDAAGQIIDWNHDVWSYPHGSRPRPAAGASSLLAAGHLATPLSPPQPRPGSGAHFGSYRNADPLYAFPRRRIVKHFVANSPWRTSSMRSLGAYANVFAIESSMDELALAAQADPVDFRLRHLQDERARAVIQAAAERAGWQPHPKGTRRWPGAGDEHGRGLAFAQYKNDRCCAAVIVDLAVDRATGVIALKRAVVAADAGLVINPNGLSNQLEGGVIQAASWTLKEAVRFDDQGIASVDWQSYPVLTMSETPEVETVLLNPPGAPPLGAGEAVHGPTAAAIANAVFDAVGVRLHQLPFTPARVLSALNP
jgi:CO/xanthine dehydrogenase Mo-binding subunit